jgi:hypothetical protein
MYVVISWYSGDPNPPVISFCETDKQAFDACLSCAGANVSVYKVGEGQAVLLAGRDIRPIGER